jgi:hypothetical protein
MQGGPSLLTLGLVVVLVAGVPLAVGLLVAGTRRVSRAASRRAATQRRLRAAAGAELRARALMGELCPHGWRAQITLFELDDELPQDAPEDPRRARVALDWAELRDGRDEIAVLRRVWAPTIVEALEAMVGDRRTDATLEQIERAAELDAAPWDDA